MTGVVSRTITFLSHTGKDGCGDARGKEWQDNFASALPAAECRPCGRAGAHLRRWAVALRQGGATALPPKADIG
jgi:hypothetical protein